MCLLLEIDMRIGMVVFLGIAATLVVSERCVSAEDSTQKTPQFSNSIGLNFVVIPTGSFTMGSDNDDERPPHRVTLTDSFELGAYEVTQEQYEMVMGKNPSRFKRPRNPVENVSWDDAVEFCKRLSELPAEKAAGSVYRLPTEAEWEYACRAHTTTKFSFGDGEMDLSNYAWYRENSDSTTHPVGTKKPNPWGLYDMHGNVLEWCQDWYDDYPSGAVTDPMGPDSGSSRVCRGGSWRYVTGGCRSAFRMQFTPFMQLNFLGFRVVRSSNK
jgi:formylglycine-generating enzyme required for sulfatase activity